MATEATFGLNTFFCVLYFSADPCLIRTGLIILAKHISLELFESEFNRTQACQRRYILRLQEMPDYAKN